MHPLALEQDFRMRADRLRSWGIGLLVCACLFWIYAAWQVFTPYDSTYNAVDCPAPINSEPRDIYFADSGSAHESALQCASDRNWPQPLAALVLSIPLSLIGTGLLTAGTVSIRLRHHEAALHSAQSAQS
ncbi:hypothetical protein OG782_20345 [Streptomyces sp. NBC_00876]|uniref:hypothetical protein n=1 Tax=Streptomyces sp. NBC_00876 TaxID=2975853 RepID=UPI00386FB3F2|nr:hypothetical protein OG782_20345 [Streptomyces sp. NBC_00876]